MARADRTRFALFGVASLANVVALLLYGLGLATHGTGGAAASLPVLIVLAGLCLLVAVVTAFRRGRDLGWPTGTSLGVCIATFALGPLGLILVGYLTFARGNAGTNLHGDPPPPASAGTVFLALMTLALPWIALAFSARLLA